ncbi:MAG: beta-ketoacyl-[acyl-carrier-protein] synthase family protein [Bacteroidota bacterium]
MFRKVYVTGIGIISSIGNNVTENLDSLLNEKAGIRHVQHIDSIYSEQLSAGEINFKNEQLCTLLGIKSSKGYTRSTLLALVAAKEACKDSNYSADENVRTGLISATTVGGMDKSELHYREFHIDNTHHCYIATHDCADHTEKLADELHINDFVTTISTACSSSANAILLGSRLIINGTLDRVLVGGSECLSKFHINGFNSMQILDPDPCKPFDENRKGINLGEAAAYLMLEAEELVIKDHKKHYCVVSGWGNACEAFHQTASSPEGTGAVLAMNKALKIANLLPSDISYINAHGTGTPNNDSSEGKAIETVFQSNIPPISSTKPYTGHTTSAAGAVEAIFSILSLQNQVLFPNLNFSNQIQELGFSPITTLKRNVPQKHVLSNSFGFGGNNTSLIFSLD